MLKDANLVNAELTQELDRVTVLVADLLGSVGVRGERERRSGIVAELGEEGRRIKLADGLSQAGGRELDRDPGFGNCLDRGLVVEPRVA